MKRRSRLCIALMIALAMSSVANVARAPAEAALSAPVIVRSFHIVPPTLGGDQTPQPGSFNITFQNLRKTTATRVHIEVYVRTKLVAGFLAKGRFSQGVEIRKSFPNSSVTDGRAVVSSVQFADGGVWVNEAVRSESAGTPAR
jgi:hypothetical protein